jgi:hypothetical protein
MATIGDPDICAEGRNLDLALLEDDPNHPELGPDQYRLVEQGIDLLR